MQNNDIITSFRKQVYEILNEGTYEDHGGISPKDIDARMGLLNKDINTFDKEYAEIAAMINFFVMAYDELYKDPSIPENSQIKRMYKNVLQMEKLLHGYDANAYNEHV